MKKIFKKIHLWVSIPFGLVITLICFSGAMLVFEKEITEHIQHDLYFVKEVKEETLPIDSLLSRVESHIDPEVKITGITISSDPERSYKVNLSKPRRAAIYIDQYSGEVKGKGERLDFFNKMFRLHRWLLDTRPEDGTIFWGKVIVGTSTILFVVILITGAIIWIPKSKAALKNLSVIHLRKGWKRFLYDLHVAGGMYALVLLLAMALTGLTWSFDWYKRAFYGTFGIEMQAQGNNNHGGKADGEKRENRDKGTTYLHWQGVYEKVAEENPKYKQITISKGKADVNFDRMGNQRAADSYRFDNRSGEITEHAQYKDGDKSRKVRGWVYSIHVGSWGGMLTRVLTFLAALLGASLPLTGYYLWIKRLYSRKKK